MRVDSKGNRCEISPNTIYQTGYNRFSVKVAYENGLVVKGDTLLEVLDKKREILQLPLYIRRFGADAFKEVDNLLLIAWSPDQVDSWLPILKARRLTLQIGADIWLPVSPIGGFETAFRAIHIDFPAYDSRFSHIQDNALKLEIALSRLLYPQGLSAKAETTYRQLITRRFRPAMLQLVSGRWNRYHKIPDRAEMLLRLKKMDRFLKKELLTTAAEWGETGFVRLLTRIFAEEAEDTVGSKYGAIDRKTGREAYEAADCADIAGKTGKEAYGAADCADIDKRTLNSAIWRQAAEELYDRMPELIQFSDLMEQYDCMSNEETKVICLDRVYTHHLLHWMYMHPFQNEDKSDEEMRETQVIQDSDRVCPSFQEEEILDGELQIAEISASQRPDRERAEKIWHLACDIAVEYMVDRIFGPVDSPLYKEAGSTGNAACIEQSDQSDGGGSVISVITDDIGDKKSEDYRPQADGTTDRFCDPMWKRQMVLDQLYRRSPVMTGEHIRQQLVRWNLTMAEIEELSVLFRQGSHDWWGRDPYAEADSQIGFRTDAYRREARCRWEAALQKWADSGEGLKQLKRGQTGKRSAAPGHAQEEAGLTKRQGYDFHSYLKQFMVMREDRLLDLDSFDPVYYTYGLKHYQDMPFIEPLETKEVMRLEELVIVIDTSGSCSGKLVRFFLEETWSVFGQEENFFDHFHVRILQCDSIVQEDVKLTSLREVEQYMKNLMIKGGGGTDFREAFTYIRRLQEKGELMHLKGILYFTDGFGTFPATAPGCRTTFVFLKSRFGEVDVPVWADKLLLPLPEGADWEPEYTGAFQMNI